MDRRPARLRPLPAKRTLRVAAAKVRARVHASRAGEAGEAVSRCLERALCDRNAATVALYWPVRTEIDVRPLMRILESRNVPMALPAISETELAFRLWRPGDATRQGAFGIPEPLAAAERIRPEAIVVPALAFDRTGNRLGYGGGFYDRSLRILRAERAVFAVGAAYDEQEVAEVPAGADDEKLDAVATDRRYIPREERR